LLLPVCLLACLLFCCGVWKLKTFEALKRETSRIDREQAQFSTIVNLRNENNGSNNSSSSNNQDLKGFSRLIVCKFAVSFSFFVTFYYTHREI